MDYLISINADMGTVLKFLSSGYPCKLNFLTEPADAKTCREASDCHQNAHCVIHENSLDYFCECLPGYRGDGVKRCIIAGLANLKNTIQCLSLFIFHM